MNIIAAFPDGFDQVTINGLHQWDWGRQLEIHDASLPAVVEVHFACQGMTDAVVRSCAVVDGVTTAAIPDVCIAQTTPIVAWVVEVGETSSETIRTITLPIIARTRPEPSATIPTSISDRYTEAVAAMNTAVEQIENGSVVAAKAVHATNADEATHATSADEATHATNAGHATNADNATTAEEASRAPAAIDRDITESEDEGTKGGCDFRFRNTHGFGTTEANNTGYFKLWSFETGGVDPEGNVIYRTALVPSTNGQQSLGWPDRQFKAVYANEIHGSLMGATSFTNNEWVDGYAGQITLTEGGFYCFAMATDDTGEVQGLVHFGLVYWNGAPVLSASARYRYSGQWRPFWIDISASGLVRVYYEVTPGGSVEELTLERVLYKKID